MWVKKYKMIRTTLDIPLVIFINEIPIKSKLSCWFSMCERYLRVIKLHGSNSDILNILKEYVFDEVVYSTLDPKKIEKLVTTQSHIAYQPLIFEYRNIGAKKIMIWYSANSIPFDYKNKRAKRYSINPWVYTSMRIDEHWVWTKEHKAYLSKISPAKVLVKKSLMFYEPEESKNITKIYDLVIFDITPRADIKITRNSIFTTTEMIKFIQEILSCVELLNNKHKKNYQVFLKHKRNFSKNHSEEYINYIKEKVTNKEITLIGSSQNLYDLIGNSKLVIGFPFTSPVIIGWELFTPSIFYCSSSLLNYSPKNEKRLFLQGKASLYTYMESELVKVK
jgi:polysaccharide biosynthesis PFTS motif protein